MFPHFPAGAIHAYGSEVNISGKTSFVDNLALRFGGENGNGGVEIFVTISGWGCIGLLLQQLLAFEDGRSIFGVIRITLGIRSISTL